MIVTYTSSTTITAVSKRSIIEGIVEDVKKSLPPPVTPKKD